MATTRLIQTKMWRDGWFVKLSDAAAKLFLFLTTNDSTRLSGFYELPLPQIAAAMGKSEGQVTKLFDELAGKVAYIDGWVCIKNYAHHQNVSNNPKVQVFVEKDLLEVPDSIQKEADALFVSHSQSHSLSHTKGMDRVSIPYQGEKNGSTEPQSAVGKKSAKAVDSIYSEEFERWWAVYPRKTGKGAAWVSWKKLSPAANLAERIIAVTLLYAKTTQWLKDDGQFVPMPATFINQRRFDDTPKVGGATGGKYSHLS